MTWKLHKKEKVIELNFDNWGEVARYVRDYTVPVTVTSPDGITKEYRPTYSGGLKKRFTGCRLIKQ